MTILTNYALRAFDAVSKAHNSTGNDTSIMDEADKKAQDIKNKSALTVAIEDFTKIAYGFHDQNSINITQDEIDPGFFASIFNPGGKNNVFRSDSAKEYIKDDAHDNINRLDIIDMASDKDGGLKYAKEDDNIYTSALNFAKADIGLIDKAYKGQEASKEDGKINIAETYHMNFSNKTSEAFEAIDLDGDPKTISAEEYASYIVAMDGLKDFEGETGFYKADGILTQDEVELAYSLSDDEIKEYAQSIYDEHYKQEE